MNNQLTNAKLSSEITSRKQGETLELLDPAVPEDPTEPKRPMVISIGAGLGCCLDWSPARAR